MTWTYYLFSQCQRITLGLLPRVHACKSTFFQDYRHVLMQEFDFYFRDTKHNPDYRPDDSETEHVCSFCDKVFESRKELKNHSKCHTAVVKPCEICGKPLKGYYYSVSIPSISALIWFYSFSNTFLQFNSLSLFAKTKTYPREYRLLSTLSTSSMIYNSS